MIDISKAGTFKLGDHIVKRMGYGAMQLAGKGVFGPPKDRAHAIAVLREAVASGVNHIDTSDYYGPYVTNQLIREALHPYPDDLVIVTKIGARRGEDASWIPAMAPAELESAVHDNLQPSRASTRSKSSTSESWARSMVRPKGRSRRRSRSWPNFSGRG